MSFACDRAEPWIVCAAVLYPHGLLIAGPRHFDPVMYALIPDSERERPQQGFIDQRGNFYNRHDAWVIAEKNGQIRYRCGGDETNGGTLFSENLY
jgi:hypothetical protein